MSFDPVSLSPDFYSFHINCGGSPVTIGNTTYDGDLYEGVPMKKSETNWAVSSTGDFLDNVFGYDLIQKNESMRSMSDADLYVNARGSPISLTYYGFCLANGNYTVKLHFAEIVFTNGNTYKSLGRRVFDVYIQVLGFTIFHYFSTNCLISNKWLSANSSL